MALVLGCAPPAEDPMGSDDWQIRNGDPGVGYADRVFHVRNLAQTLNGTGSFVRYPRCTLTADHVPLGRAYQGALTQTVKLDSLRSRGPSAFPVGVPYARAYADFRVGFLEARTGADTFDPYTMDHFTLAQPTLAGLTVNLNLNSPAEFTTIPVPENLVTAVGFGSINPANDLALRSGTFDYYAYRPASRAGLEWGTSLMLAHRQTTQLCAGDSGGPVLDGNGQVIGVLSQAFAGVCTGLIAAPAGQTQSVGLAAGFTTAADDPEESNWNWMDRAVELSCGKLLLTLPEGDGSVAGTRVGPDVRLFEDEAGLDGEVQCDASDLDACNEIVHFDEVVDLEATPDPGWVFDHWESSEAAAPCPCEGGHHPQLPRHLRRHGGVHRHPERGHHVVHRGVRVRGGRGL